MMIPVGKRMQLQKHAYSNILEITPPKKKTEFSDKNSDFFSYFYSKHSEHSLESRRRGGVLSRNKKNNVYHCKSQFYYKNWG